MGDWRGSRSLLEEIDHNEGIGGKQFTIHGVKVSYYDTPFHMFNRMGRVGNKPLDCGIYLCDLLIRNSPC